MKMVRIQQQFTQAPLADVAAATRTELDRMDAAGLIGSGRRIAVGMGSRGVSNMALIIRTIIDYLKDRGNQPFIIPAMGSHGNACAEGQLEVMASYGVTEEAMGAPIVAGTETVLLGYTEEHHAPCYAYKPAVEADLVIPVNRIKVHTDFKGPIESGLHKMLSIGLGSLAGATALHSYGSAKSFQWLIPEVGGWLARKLPMSFGVGVVEDSYENTAAVRAITVENLYKEEAELLAWSRSMMPRFIPEEFEVLVVERFGKDISGAGMDPNIVGRTSIPGSTPFPGPKFQFCVVLDLTEACHGNAAAISCADFITRRVFDKMDLKAMYQNVLACHNPFAAFIPVIAGDEKETIDLACRTCVNVATADGQPRVVRIKDTLHMGEILITPNMVEQVRDLPGVTVLDEVEV